ncbi:type II secretion system protein [Candidatus Margulisiibacteriota bacterium]
MNIDNRGFTLIEIIMAIVLIGIFASLASGPLIVLLNKGFLQSADRQDVRSSARHTHTVMSRSIRNIKDAYSITTASENIFAYYDVDDSFTAFQLSGNRLLKTVSANTYDLAGQVRGLAFTYYNNTENALSSPVTGTANPTDIRLIGITLALGEDENRELTLNMQVRPRNLR